MNHALKPNGGLGELRQNLVSRKLPKRAQNKALLKFQKQMNRNKSFQNLIEKILPARKNSFSGVFQISFLKQNGALFGKSFNSSSLFLPGFLVLVLKVFCLAIFFSFLKMLTYRL